MRQNTYVSPSAQPVQNRIDGRSKKEPHDGEEKSCADKTEHGYPIILSHAAFGRLRLSAAPQHSYDL
ncbi:hypothetical protein CLOM621_06688 [Clostridium sp. M62/1]|nr:hypothetical protein CLOM621_06688 [Clostridium sp. M62/1]